MSIRLWNVKTIMHWPSWHDGVFSLRTFCAAMLTAWISLRINLTSPGTAMLTVYIVSQPLTGMMLSKSVYRVLGTFAGTLASVAFVALFAQSRELFVLASALWFGGCIYVSVLLRDAPGAYAPLLAGYTAAIVGFPAILVPETVFDIAADRCVEILLAIGCAGLLSAVVLPRPVGPVLRGRIEDVLAAATKSAVGILRSGGATEPPQADRARLIADAVALETLRAHAVFDTPAIRAANDLVQQLQGRLFDFLAVLISVQDRARLLRLWAPARWQAITPAVEAVARIMDRSPGPDQPGADPIDAARRLIDSLQPDPGTLRRSEPAMLVRLQLDRLRDLLSLRDQCLRLRDHIAAGTRPPVMLPTAPISRYRDHFAALMAGATAFVALIVSCAFWILTSWPDGAPAASLLVIVFGLFSSLDDPAAAARIYLRMGAAAFVVSLIYATLILPRTDDFGMLALALAPVLIPPATLMSVPKIGLSMLLFCICFLIFFTYMVLPDRTSLDFAKIVNNGLAALAGIAMAVAMLQLLRPLGSQWVVRRLVRGIMTDLGQLASDADTAQGAFESRMFDRVNGLFSRLDQNAPHDRQILRGSLASLRVGHNIAALRRLSNGPPSPAARTAEAVLAALARHFAKGRPWSGRIGKETVAVLVRSEEALRVLDQEPDTLVALVSVTAIRITLSDQSGFFALPQTDAPPLTRDAAVLR